MTSSTKTKSLVFWTSLACASFVAALAIPYMEGRSNSVWVVPPMLPARIVTVLLLLVSCVALLRQWFVAIRTNRNEAAAGKCFALGVALFVLCIMLGGSRLYLGGFTQYAKTVLAPDEWRSISQAAQARLKPQGRLPGPKKGSLWEEQEHRALWSDLCQNTQIQKLDPSLMIFVRRGETRIEWGGALVGHRGVTIYTSGNKPNQNSSLSRTGFIAEDIAVSISSY